MVHLVNPAVFLRIMPGWVAAPDFVIHATGLAEIAGAAALAQPFSSALRKAAGCCLAVYALCVWPANINHLLIDAATPGGGWGWAYHIPRMILQPVLIWAALWASGAIDWPWRSARSKRDNPSGESY
ncbi:MAG: hypothetical protein EON93_12055 [Burkholderiales bacterium]|nr:MAG: hypothetical protein EON93_12055 [Burkholderiales bacterium]